MSAATITLYASVSAALVSTTPTVSNVAAPPTVGVCATDFVEARDTGFSRWKYDNGLDNNEPNNDRDAEADLIEDLQEELCGLTSRTKEALSQIQSAIPAAHANPSPQSG
jgi:hypothetical protein